ncbi:MAG: HNH endonuclease [Candidatus Nomurabacteria bacterium]|jgi:putative restriction endonuclease|nr:HNH endonuclease [Candidatus Nomurabacteria bacterium]
MNKTRLNWTLEETRAALILYHMIPFGSISANNPRIIEFAKSIGRTSASVSMKLSNFARFDPALQQRGVAGLTHGSKLDEKVWNEFEIKPEEFILKGEAALAKLQGKNLKEIVEKELADNGIILPKGSERKAMVTKRVNQEFFRKRLLISYGHKCCITGMSVGRMLVASHIIPWSDKNYTHKRTDPRNGLLLNSLHNQAFDTGLITVTPDYTVKASEYIKSLPPNDMTKAWLIDIDGQKITLPNKYLPDEECLRYHNERIFINTAQMAKLS